MPEMKWTGRLNWGKWSTRVRVRRGVARGHGKKGWISEYCKLGGAEGMHPQKIFRFMGSESLILLWQFESICLSCFRIVIDFLLFSLVFFFFHCFSITTLTVIIRSAFYLFWLPYYMTFSQHVYFIFTVRKFGFCEIFVLWITLSKSRHHFFVNDFISTNATWTN